MVEKTQGFFENGYAVVRSAISETGCQALEAALRPIVPDEGDDSSALPGHGIRNLLSLSPSIRSLVSKGRLNELASFALGAPSFPVKAIYFDKLPGANWGVPWHQDLSISVEQKVDLPGFINWTVKAGVAHVQPPASVLESIVTLRIHLDDCPAANGALRVVPGSHQQGRLDSSLALDLRRQRGEVICEALRGDVLIMSPLILHSSPRAEVANHRRIVHIEYSSESLPEPLHWQN